MTTKGADLFVSDAGPEVSVRTSRDFATSEVMLEPLYASDIEQLEGATGELRAQGKTLRGRLRRQGAAFMLLQERAQVPVTPSKGEPSPAPVPVVTAAPVAPPVPVVAPVPAPSGDSASQADGPSPPDIDVLDAAVTVSRFIRGETGVDLEAAKRAYMVVGRFIAERDRQARARK